MKNLLTITCFLILLVSCKKEQPAYLIKATPSTAGLKNEDEYLRNVKKYLKHNLSYKDYEDLEFRKIVATKFKHGKIYLLRLQFKKRGNEFLLLKTDSLGNCLKGMILNIACSNSENLQSRRKRFQSFDGEIVASSLHRHLIGNLTIKNGYASKKKSKTGDLVLPDDNTLPDVTVTAYIPSSGGISYADWYNILDFYSPQELGLTVGGGGGNSGSSYGYYSPVNPFDYSYTDYDHIPVEEPKPISYEDPLLPPAISLLDYLKCFDAIPDDGANCSIEIFTDIPVNGEPNTFFDWRNGSPGHTFLQIKKGNATTSVQQNIGFYPDQGWKTMFYTPVAPKFVDDGDHEFNASLKMNITPTQMHTILTTMKSLIDASYDIDEYNCTDFALQVFNSVRTANPITIPLYVIPGNTASTESETPQGLYQKLSSMKEAGIEAGNITLPGVCGYVGASDGPCN